MKAETVAKDNCMFFVVVVGMSLGLDYFAKAVLSSFRQDAQFPTDNVGSPGYIRIICCFSDEKSWEKFAEQVIGGLFARLSYEFSSKLKTEGGLSEQVTLQKEGYVFDFNIRGYERDDEHRWEIIGPEKLDDIPENEKMGRVVYLSIKPE